MHIQCESKNNPLSEKASSYLPPDTKMANISFDDGGKFQIHIKVYLTEIGHSALKLSRGISVSYTFGKVLCFQEILVKSLKKCPIMLKNAMIR